MSSVQEMAQRELDQGVATDSMGLEFGAGSYSCFRCSFYKTLITFVYKSGAGWVLLLAGTWFVVVWLIERINKSGMSFVECQQARCEIRKGKNRPGTNGSGLMHILLSYCYQKYMVTV